MSLELKAFNWIGEAVRWDGSRLLPLLYWLTMAAGWVKYDQLVIHFFDSFTEVQWFDRQDHWRRSLATCWFLQQLWSPISHTKFELQIFEKTSKNRGDSALSIDVLVIWIDWKFRSITAIWSSVFKRFHVAIEQL